MPTSFSRSAGIPEAFSRPAEIPEAFNPDFVHELALLRGEAPAIAGATIALMGLGGRLLLEDNAPPLIRVSNERAPAIEITDEGWRTIDACARYLAQTEGPDWANQYLDEHAGDTTFEEKVERAVAAARSAEEEPQRTQVANRYAARTC